MKSIKSMLLIIAATSTLSSCWLFPDHDPDPVEAAIFNQSIEIPATEGSQTYTVSDLKKNISGEISNTGSTWLTVEKLPYSSGSPQVKLSYKANTGGERSAVVIFRDDDNNQVNLTVEQPEAEEPEPVKTGIEDPHNTQSDQPAYSRHH